MDKRPNILFLMSDEHRADVTGFEGNDVVHTPNLDGLAQSGVVFRNAYTPSPICVPVYTDSPSDHPVRDYHGAGYNL